MIRRARVAALVAVLSVFGAAVRPETPAAGDLLRDALWLKHRGRPAGQRPRVALVLSGGGARGLAHIGALKVLAREKVPVDLIVGTSVGSIVGALYAAEVPVDEIETMAARVGWDKLTDVSTARVVRLLVSERLLSTAKMEDYLTARIGPRVFADLKTELACVAADLRTGEEIILREGPVALAARASATMPGVFDPVPYRHRLLIDGGVVNNVPTDVARRLGADIVICVYPAADFSRHNVTNVLSTLMQALYIQGQVISEERLKLADLVIRPDVADISASELGRSREAMDAGQRAAEAALPEIKNVLAAKFLERAARGAGPR
ncbi:MAG: patatin-like phospholipase family protein [Elusimicrobia bacterium]|nr:patatin-like phospholipase family protein [Elusimicrobiota bacterium]MBK7207618.1 patatin-like phospholipase family protein [Elusimicrobiota bacterium]MBK7544388.1 patatin-like phospholipase family protein [Elusimicrobiota bacterium]MBK7573910.1 patatin-like phospholipase family protein [Elusimicrobiota bacterium]MBK7689508.1 patatin-like phospholipase family protein [Elusimicrobiota bacterium]